MTISKLLRRRNLHNLLETRVLRKIEIELLRHRPKGYAVSISFSLFG